MTAKLLPGETQVALALCQAACYACMSAKDLANDSSMYTDMARLVTRLTDLALVELEEGPEAPPAPEVTSTASESPESPAALATEPE